MSHLEAACDSTYQGKKIKKGTLLTQEHSNLAFVKIVEDFKTKVELSPNIVVGLIVAVVVLEYVLHNLI